MDFNVDKCGVMHTGRRNFEFQYQMNDGWIKSIDEEKDLRVIISKGLKFLRQYLMAKNKANSILGIINKKSIILKQRALLLGFFFSFQVGKVQD